MIYLALGFAPGIYWLWFFYRKDRWEPEPKKLILKSYLLGIVVALVILFLISPFKINFMLSAIIIAPIIEETGKFLVVRLFFYSHKEFDEPIDGIIYASAVALGFASIENAIYLFRINDLSSSMIYQVLLIRSLLSVPGHALFSSFWGYALAKAKFRSLKNKNLTIFAGLLVGIFFHSVFNLLCYVKIYSNIALLFLIGFLWIILNLRVDRALDQSKYNQLRTNLGISLRRLIMYKRDKDEKM